MKRDDVLYCIQKITGNNLNHFTNIELKDWVKDYLKLKKSNQNLNKNKMEKFSLPPIRFYADNEPTAIYPTTTGVITRVTLC